MMPLGSTTAKHLEAANRALDHAEHEARTLRNLPCDRSRNSIQRSLRYLGNAEAHREAAGRGRTRAEKAKRSDILLRALNIGEKIDTKLRSCLRDW
jgi:hypothetical protein